MILRTISRRILPIAPLLLIPACGGEGFDPEKASISGSGGNSEEGSGGSSAEGSGGAQSMGGAESTGGTKATGGAESTGGAGTGGAGTGGAGTGGAGTGGSEPLISPIQLFPVADSMTIANQTKTAGAGSHGNENWGAADTMAVGVYDNNTIERTLIRFSLPAQLTAASITKAELHLSIEKMVPKVKTEDFTIDVYRLLKSWKEGAGTGQDVSTEEPIVDGVTALERFLGDQDGEEDWAVAGVGLSGVDASTLPIAQTTQSNDSEADWVFDVTQEVVFWAGSPSLNQGVILVAEDDQGGQVDLPHFPVFHSRESTEVAKRPRLIVTFVED